MIDLLFSEIVHSAHTHNMGAGAKWERRRSPPPLENKNKSLYGGFFRHAGAFFAMWGTFLSLWGEGGFSGLVLPTEISAGVHDPKELICYHSNRSPIFLLK